MDIKIKLRSTKIFHNELEATHKIKTTLTLRKQACIKMYILELSKVPMYALVADKMKAGTGIVAIKESVALKTKIYSILANDCNEVKKIQKCIEKCCC